MIVEKVSIPFQVRSLDVALHRARAVATARRTTATERYHADRKGEGAGD